jgi:ubiquinone biosynthesis protein
MLRENAPGVWARRAGQAWLDSARLAVDLPQQLRRLITLVERGSLQVGVRQTDLEPLVVRLEQLVNRLVLGIIAAAFIIGLAVLMAVYHPNWEQWAGPTFALGFGIAAALGLYLAWVILHGRRA